MNLLVNNPNITFDMEGNAKLTVDILPESKLDLLDEAEYISKSKLLSLNLERSFRHRSLNANSMFWALCQKLADALDVSNQDMYERLLWDYGMYVIIDIPEYIDEESVLKEDNYRIIDYVGTVKIGEIEVKQYRCFPGTSIYNTKEISRLIKGAIYECQELGIPTESRKDVEKALEEWNGKGFIQENSSARPDYEKEFPKNYAE